MNLNKSNFNKWLSSTVSDRIENGILTADPPDPPNEMVRWDMFYHVLNGFDENAASPFFLPMTLLEDFVGDFQLDFAEDKEVFKAMEKVASYSQNEESFLAMLKPEGAYGSFKDLLLDLFGRMFHGELKHRYKIFVDPSRKDAETAHRCTEIASVGIQLVELYHESCPDEIYEALNCLVHQLYNELVS